MTEAAKKTLRQPSITVNYFNPFRFFFFLIQLINFHTREGSLKQTLRNKYNQWLYNVTNVTLSHLVYCINKLFKKYNKLVWKIWSGLKNYEPELKLNHNSYIDNKLTLNVAKLKFMIIVNLMI